MKHCWTSTRLHGAISQKTAIFIFADMRTSDPTDYSEVNGRKCCIVINKLAVKEIFFLFISGLAFLCLVCLHSIKQSIWPLAGQCLCDLHSTCHCQLPYYKWRYVGFFFWLYSLILMHIYFSVDVWFLFLACCKYSVDTWFSKYAIAAKIPSL